MELRELLSLQSSRRNHPTENSNQHNRRHLQLKILTIQEGPQQPKHGHAPHAPQPRHALQRTATSQRLLVKIVDKTSNTRACEFRPVCRDTHKDKNRQYNYARALTKQQHLILWNNARGGWPLAAKRLAKFPTSYE